MWKQTVLEMSRKDKYIAICPYCDDDKEIHKLWEKRGYRVSSKICNNCAKKLDEK